MPFSVKWALCIFKQIMGAGRGTDPNNLTQCSGCCRMLRKNTGSQTRAQAPLLYYRFVTHIGRLLITRCLKLAGVMPMTLASSPATKHTQKLLCLGKLEVSLEIAGNIQSYLFNTSPINTLKQTGTGKYYMGTAFQSPNPQRKPFNVCS